ncbi:PulJ/GspJ family protein [Peribacillus asahii]|uniref:PulJ/GspJ family protein n=1 Tax=Peribacillus asahii TaxID=228899 RepID=UPI000FDCBD2A|nr:prepilin-type N-terminal cleavage/methylation domain-containing protein [Peribacillus asahii]USK84261.1 prepilin-type N-terminal cleavage/methylation domain-containing protein [Peribacillus asahii]
MGKKYISQQSGVTLIELLAALAISTLLIGIVYGVFTYSVQSNNKTQSHINLRQEANLIITEMRKRHQEATANYEICYDELLANELPSKQGLLLEKVSIGKTTVNQTTCKEEIDPSQALPVQFTLTDQQNHNQFTIDTVIEGRRMNESSVSVPIVKPGVCLPNSSEIKEGDKVYSSDTELKNREVDSVAQNLYAKGTLTMKNGSMITVGCNAIFEKTVTMHNDSTLLVNGNATFKDKVEIKNGKNGGGMLIKGDAYFEDLDLKNDAKLEVRGNAHFNGEFIKPDKGSICVKGQATFKNNPPTYYEVKNVTSCGNSNGIIYVLNQKK